jgi:hypothetical protein
MRLPFEHNTPKFAVIEQAAPLLSCLRMPRRHARVTLPERMQLAQTLMRFGVPPSLILTVWMFTFHFLLVWRLEWETLLPDACPLPHIAHFLDIVCLLFDCVPLRGYSPRRGNTMLSDSCHFLVLHRRPIHANLQNAQRI